MQVEAQSDIQTQVPTGEMRAEAASQLKSARELAKKVRAEAVRELEDARARVKRIAAREEEMAARWAKLLEAEQEAALAVATAPPIPVAPAAPPPQITTTDAPGLIAEAQAQADRIIEQAGVEARQIREEAMRLLGMAEGEKAESHEIAQSETERAMHEAENLRSQAEAEAKRLRDEAQRVATDNDNDSASIYAKRGGRKLPRIGEGATSVLSQMSDLRSKSAEDEDRQVV